MMTRGFVLPVAFACLGLLGGAAAHRLRTRARPSALALLRTLSLCSLAIAAAQASSRLVLRGHIRSGLALMALAPMLLAVEYVRGRRERGGDDG